MPCPLSKIGLTDMVSGALLMTGLRIIFLEDNNVWSTILLCQNRLISLVEFLRVQSWGLSFFFYTLMTSLFVQTSSILFYLLMILIYFSHHDLNTLQTIINNELKKISNWFKLNKLSLNIKKTNFMIFKNKYSNKPNNKIQIKIDDTEIAQVDTTKFLGLLIDHDLSWTSHTQHVTKIVSKYNGIIRRVKPFLPLDSLVTLYNSLVLPNLSYCAIVWADKNNAHLHSLFLLQKRAIRTCTNSLWLEHTDPLFIKLNTLKIHDIHRLQLASFMFQFHYNLLPPDLLGNDFFNMGKLSHNYYTRHYHDTYIKNTNTVLAQNTAMTQGPLLWNSLSDDLKNRPSFASFKFHLKKTLIDHYDPSPS